MTTLNQTKQQYSGRWNHVYKLWKSALSQETLPQMDRWLSNEFAKNSKYGSKDRRWYSDVLFSAVRHGYFALFYIHLNSRPLSEKLIEEFKHKYQTQLDIFLAFKKVDLEVFFQIISQRSDLEKEKSQNYLNLAKDLQNNPLLETNLLFYSIPLWFLSSIEERVKVSQFNFNQVKKFLHDFDSRPPLWIRLNHLEKKDSVIEELSQEKYLVEDFESCLKVVGAKGVFGLHSYRNGFFEIQDLASQKIGAHVKAQPKQYIWDCCAGGGGKTLQIASFLKNKGVVYASDIREYKLEEVKKRAKRAGFFNIRCLTWDGENLPQFQKEVQIKGGFDWVLVDAPCSSSGTWRRNPDAKYRINMENIEILKQLQLKILTSAKKAVVAGGFLVYSTCSWIVAENEGVVQQFLKQNPEFSFVEQNLLGSPFHNADTMFAAVLKKN